VPGAALALAAAEVFGFGFPEVAIGVGRSEAACRQLVVRDATPYRAGRPRLEADRREREEVAARFFDALPDGDVDGLSGLLAAVVQMMGAIVRDRDGKIVGTLTLDVLDGRIQTIRAVANPTVSGQCARTRHAVVCN
jgi:RNA polymerase sigma-70 factor (ECF subfamily)